MREILLRSGSRLRHLRASRTYAYVLLPIVATCLFIALAPDTDWYAAVLVLLSSATLIIALWTSRSGPVGYRTGLAVLGVSAAAVALLVGGDGVSGAIGLLNGLLVVAIAIVIGRGVVSEGEVNGESVIGAICIYLLLGLFFLFVYSALAAFDSGPFFVQGTDGTPAVRLYFSFITQTTVGYGDYTAAGDLARTLSALEALIGQLYLVTVVALLVSRLGGRARGPASP